MNKKIIFLLILQGMYKAPIGLSFPLLFFTVPKAAWILLILSPAMVLTPLWLLFAKKTTVVTNHHNQKHIQRYVLPKWLQWAATPDEHLPGGMYEPAVLAVYEKTNWFVSSWNWLGVRNMGAGIPWGQAIPVPNYFHKLTDAQKRGHGIWQKSIPLWLVEIRYGWWVFKDNYSLHTDKGFVAVPHITLRRKGRD